MKNLSRWASRHARLAIFLVIVLELANGINGVLLGATLLDRLPAVWLYILMTGLIVGVIYLHYFVNHQTIDRGYWFTRRCLFVAFLGNFLLFTLLGGLWGQPVQTSHPMASVLGERSRVVVRHTSTFSDSTRRESRSVTSASIPSDEKPGNRRGLYFLLGILGIAVTYVTAAIACSILCSGYGFFALLAFYAGLGGLAGSVYFFSRAVSKTPKRRRDMTQPERRRDIWKFWLTWLILIGITSVLVLIASTSN